MKKNKITPKKKKPRIIQKKITRPFPKIFLDGEKSLQMFRAAIVSFSILVGAGSFYLAHQTTYYSNEAAILRHAKEEKITWMRQIDGAILNIRQVRDNIARECKYGTPLSLKEQDKMRNDALTDFIKAANGARFIFNEQLQDKGREFIRFDHGIKDVCTSDAPDDSVWKEKMLAIDEIMGELIRENNKKLVTITTKRIETEHAPFWRFLWPYWK